MNKRLSGLVTEYVEGLKKSSEFITKPEYFKVLWGYYGDKGNEDKAYSEWLSLSAKDRIKAMAHITYYSIVTDNEQKPNFEDYLASGEWKKNLNQLEKDFEELSNEEKS